VRFFGFVLFDWALAKGWRDSLAFGFGLFGFGNFLPARAWGFALQ
jgi:hypothetical protein